MRNMERGTKIGDRVGENEVRGRGTWNEERKRGTGM